MFQGWLYSDESIEKWREAAGKSDINPLAMMQFALLYWLHKKRGAPLEVELIRFTKLIRAICSIAGMFLFMFNSIYRGRIVRLFRFFFTFSTFYR